MLYLPTFNATLNPCPVSPDTFTAHAQGNFCGSCQRVVQDFSQSRNPVADLAAARAASPDGRVCGSFRKAQLVQLPAPALSRRLRWFLMALVLVVGQGLTAREALAQVRRPVPHKSTTPHKKHTPVAEKWPLEQVQVMEISGDIVSLPEVNRPVRTGNEVYAYVEQMPELPGGGGTAAIVAYIQKRVRYPQAQYRTEVEGRVFAAFIVGKDGLVREARIVKGLAPLLDEETLRVIQALPAFTPGRQSGEAVAVSFTIPVTFRIKQ